MATPNKYSSRRGSINFAQRVVITAKGKVCVVERLSQVPERMHYYDNTPQGLRPRFFSINSADTASSVEDGVAGHSFQQNLSVIALDRGRD